MLAGGDKVGSLADVEFTLVWCGPVADSLLLLSFVLAFFRLNSVKKGFSVSLIAVCPLRCQDLARFGTLAEFGTMAE